MFGRVGRERMGCFYTLVRVVWVGSHGEMAAWNGPSLRLHKAGHGPNHCSSSPIVYGTCIDMNRDMFDSWSHGTCHRGWGHGMATGVGAMAHATGVGAMATGSP